MKKNLLLLTLVIALSGISFIQAQTPNRNVYRPGVQPARLFRPLRRFHPPRRMRRPMPLAKPQTQPPLQQMPKQIQPLTPQEMQQLNQLVPPITGPHSNTPPLSGLPNLPGSMMSKRDRVKNYTVLQRVGNIYVVSSPDNRTYVLRSDSSILRKYKCHIVYPYTYCAKKHKKTHKPKHGLY